VVVFGTYLNRMHRCVMFTSHRAFSVLRGDVERSVAFSFPWSRTTEDKRGNYQLELGRPSCSFSTTKMRFYFRASI
jgi:hypothetical protein